jgi:hypothetical protein
VFPYPFVAENVFNKVQHQKSLTYLIISILCTEDSFSSLTTLIIQSRTTVGSTAVITFNYRFFRNTITVFLMASTRNDTIQVENFWENNPTRDIPMSITRSPRIKAAFFQTLHPLKPECSL